MNCPKHVEFYSKNKFEKLVHLVGFIIRIYDDARSPECQGLSWAFRVYSMCFVTPEAKDEANVFPLPPLFVPLYYGDSQ